MKIGIETLRFAVVGSIGFVVDTGVLYLLQAPFGLYGGRVVSFLAAVFTTWLLNRQWTFAHRHSAMPRHKEFALYLSLMLIGGALNYAAYAVLVASSPLSRHYLILAVAAGSLAGMVANWLSSRFLLFRHHHS